MHANRLNRAISARPFNTARLIAATGRTKRNSRNPSTLCKFRSGGAIQVSPRLHSPQEARAAQDRVLEREFRAHLELARGCDRVENLACPPVGGQNRGR